jgi:SpoVK/Ycf46/Vps4 family AAA+-type ATPase
MRKLWKQEVCLEVLSSSSSSSSSASNVLFTPSPGNGYERPVHRSSSSKTTTPFSFKDMNISSPAFYTTPTKPSSSNKATNNLNSAEIVFIVVDEIDVLGDGKADQLAANNKQRVIKQELCAWFDELNAYYCRHRNTAPKFYCMVGTSNRSKDIDPSLRRGGRFEVEIQVLTRKHDRELLLIDRLAQIDNMDPSIDRKEVARHLAEVTGGYVAADLVALVDDVRGKDPAAVCSSSSSDWLKLFYEAMTRIPPSCLRGATIEKPEISYEEVIGCDHAKAALKRLLQFTETSKAKLRELFSISNLGGILLYGPPGNSKTRLVLAAASSHQLPLISLSSADVYSPYVGDAEGEIRKAFAIARQGSPCILFFDELDALVSNRSDTSAASSSSNVESRILATLLNEMDGISTNSLDVIVMAATNRIDAIDAALLRKGRFQHLVQVPLPSYEDLVQLLEYFARKLQLNQGWKSSLESRLFVGQSGADVENICREEKMKQIYA